MGIRGETPVIKASMLRGEYNVLSAVTAEGEMDYSIQDGTCLLYTSDAADE